MGMNDGYIHRDEKRRKKMLGGKLTTEALGVRGFRLPTFDF